jgi:hypothetical protein
MLTAEKLALRREIGASDTPVIMWNDAERLNRLICPTTTMCIAATPWKAQTSTGTSASWATS